MKIIEGKFYLIASSWGNAGPRMAELHNKKMSNAIGSGASLSSEEVLGEQYATMFHSHIAQVSRSQELINRMTNCVTPYHHYFGLCGEIGGVPFTDMSMVIASSSALDNNYDQVKWNDTVLAMHGVTLEAAGIQENTGPVGVCATTILDLAMQAGNKIFDGKSANWTGTVKPALSAGGYDSTTLNNIENWYVNGGFRVAIPEDGTMSLGLWNGFAYYALPATAPGDYGAFGILGGSKGGAGSAVNDEQPAVLPIEEYKTRVSSIAFQDGNFSWSNTDLTLGSESEPYGLSLKRFYNASRAASDGPLGRGWTHNLNMGVSAYSDIMQGLAESGVLAGAAAIVEMYVCVSLLSDLTRPHDKFVIASLANQWLSDNLVNNIVSVNSANVNAQFVKLPSGSYALPPKSDGSLVKNGDGTYTFKTLDQVAYNFNSSGQIATIVYPFGVTWTFSYTSGKLTSVSTGMGRTLTLNYTGNRLTSVSDGTGRSVTYSVNGSGNLTQVTDPDSKNVTYVYDSSNRMTQVFYPAFPSNAYVTNVYDSLGQVKEQKDAYDNLTSYYYAGSRTEIVNPAGKRFVTYLNRFGDAIRSINHLGKVTTSAFDALGRLVKVVEPELNSTEYVYNIDNQPITITRKPKTGSGSIVNSFTYHSTFKNKVATSMDGKGLVTTMSYNATTGQLTTIQQPQVGGQTPTTTLTYNARGQVETITDPTGVVTKTTYDSTTERVLSVIGDFGVSPHLNLTTSFGHNSRGDVTNITDPRGYVTTVQFDVKRRATQTTAPAPFSYVTKMTYDANDNLTKVERQTNIVATPWQTFERTYAIDNKLLTTKSPTNDVTTLEYNNLRQLKKVTDPMLRVVEYAYDDLGRPLTTKDATGTVSSTQTYTDNGNIASIKDARNNTTNFSYDEYDRPKRTTDADTKWTEISTYDANGNPLTVTTRDSQTITFGFDNLNRVTSRTASPTASYSYDLAGRLLTASKAVVPGDAGTGVFTNFYDTAGRFYKEQYPDGKSVTHVLDPNGNVTKTTYPDGFFVENSYDQLNRMTGTKVNGAGTNAISYSYDALSRQTSQTYENGASKTISYALDNVVTDIDHNFVGSTVSFDYAYNANNEPSTMQVSDAAYMWNPLVSRTISYGTANSINTYPTVGGAAQQYTNLGALKDDGQTAFSYNNINQLTNVSRGALSVSYSYDPNDRQVQKTVYGGAETQFYYSGSMRLADASGGTVQDRFVYGVDGQIAMKVSSAGANTYYHTDREGSVIGLSNSSGAVTNKFAYSSFGESVDLSGTTHGYLGQRIDSETGLTVGAGGSTFDPSLGRVVTATTGGSFGFGNIGGSNAQQGPGPVANPGQQGGTNGVKFGFDQNNPLFAFVPPVPESSPPVIYLPTIQDPTKRDKGGVGSNRKDLLKLILDTFRELTIGDAERLLEYLSKPHSHEENFQKAIEMIVDKYGFKALGKLGTIVRNIHGNSHGASNTQWVYQIFDTVSQTVHKYGITGKPANRPGQFPPRVQSQLNKLNKGNPGQYDAGIVDEINHGLPGARGDARNIEVDLNTDFLNTHGQLPPGNKRI
jgi:YD repeat-containing protein